MIFSENRLPLFRIMLQTGRSMTSEVMGRNHAVRAKRRVHGSTSP